MAIAIGNNSTTNGDNQTTLTRSHTVAVGANRLLVAVVTADGGASAPTGVTWDGDALTLLGGNEVASPPRAWVYYRIAPKEGTYDVVATWGTGVDYQALAVINYTGVHQTSPLSVLTTVAQAIANTCDVDVASASGELCMGILQTGIYSEWAEDVGTTLLLISRYSNIGCRIVYKDGEATCNLAWSNSSNNRFIAGCGFAIKPAAALDFTDEIGIQIQF